MELIKYLNDYFFTLQELLEVAKVEEQAFRNYQDAQLMPLASYKLNLEFSSDSFFGLHQEVHELEYYAKGYVSWLGVIQSHKDKERIYAEFSRRYTAAIELLKLQGHASADPKINSNLSLHIEEEWRHFIKGIYGLCTKSGLPEDIAAKEMAIIQINELLEKSDLNNDDVEGLSRAVNTLDQASSLFAPHERVKSSRQRLVNEVRSKYKL